MVETRTLLWAFGEFTEAHFSLRERSAGMRFPSLGTEEKDGSREMKSSVVDAVPGSSQVC